jgi:hypothetical protein
LPQNKYGLNKLLFPQTGIMDKLKSYHILLPILFIPICLFLIVDYGWIGYATISNRPGLNGDWYYYYNIPKPIFCIYEFLVAGIAFVFIIFQLTYLIFKNPEYLTITFKRFGIFLVSIIACEIILAIRFTGKG